MAIAAAEKNHSASTLLETAAELGAIFAERAGTRPDEDAFVSENFALLKARGLVEAGVPLALGGGGASIDELSSVLRTLAYHCGSTALAFAMHTHQVAIPAWRWTHQKAAAPVVEPLLKHDASHPGKLRTIGGTVNPANHDDAVPAAGALKVALGDLRFLKKEYL